MRTPTWILLGTLGPLLTACGGDGASVASLPPPPPPAPAVTTTVTVYASPATRAATYDTIALVDKKGPGGGDGIGRLAAPGEFRISTYQPTANANEVSYTLEIASDVVPGGTTVLTDVFPAQHTATELGPLTLRFGDQFKQVSGSTTLTGGRLENVQTTGVRTDIGGGQQLSSQLAYYAGLSHVSLGQWSWAVLGATGNITESGAVFFVHGDRTADNDMPVSGTATYVGQATGTTDLHNYGGAIDITLQADFAERSMTAQLSRVYWEGGDAVGGYTYISGVDLHGSGTIAAPGTFTIPLTGTVDTAPVTGALDGAFFGPGAQQVGGVFDVGTSIRPSVLSDAFVAGRTGP